VWLHTGEFPDERPSAGGGLLSVSSGRTLYYGGDYAVYAIIDQMLWRAGDQSLSFFARLSAAPSDRNLIDRYFDTGLAFKGPIEGRPNDVVGIAFAYGRISPQATASGRATSAFEGTPMPVRDFEAVIELTYQLPLSDQWYVQPDLQYVIHPGGHIADPLDPAKPRSVKPYYPT
jgi:porin